MTEEVMLLHVEGKHDSDRKTSTTSPKCDFRAKVHRDFVQKCTVYKCIVYKYLYKVLQ